MKLAKENKLTNINKWYLYLKENKMENYYCYVLGKWPKQKCEEVFNKIVKNVKMYK